MNPFLAFIIIAVSVTLGIIWFDRQWAGYYTQIKFQKSVRNRIKFVSE